MKSLFSGKEKWFFGSLLGLLGLLFVVGGIGLNHIVSRSQEIREELQESSVEVEDAKHVMLISYLGQFQILESWLADKKMASLMTAAERDLLEGVLPRLKENYLKSTTDLQSFDLQLVQLANATSRLSAELARVSKRDPRSDLVQRLQDLLRVDHEVNRARAVYVQAAYDFNSLLSQSKQLGGALSQRLVQGNFSEHPLFESDRVILEARTSGPETNASP